jgi:hypothetical protein
MKTNKIISDNVPMQILANSNNSNADTKVWAMNAQGQELETILKEFCNELDDFIQIAADNNDEEMSNAFAKDYNDMERFYIKVKNKINLTYNERNLIRSTMKHDVKSIFQYSC